MIIVISIKMQRRLVLPLSASLEVWRVQNCRRSCEGLRTVHLYSCKPKGVNTTTSLGDIPSRDMIGPPCPHVAKGTNQDHTGGGGGRHASISNQPTINTQEATWGKNQGQGLGAMKESGPMREMGIWGQASTPSGLSQ